MKLILSLALLTSTAFGQYTPAGAVFPTAVAANPVFVSENSVNSTLTNAVTTRAASTTTCVSFGECVPFADPALSGNLGIIAGHFANSTTLTPTATDDQSDSFTCTTGSAKDSGTNEWPYLCYKANLTAAAHLTTTVFGTTSVTQVTEKVAQFSNVATTTPLDGSIGSCAGATSTTANCASVTTTQANDLIYVLVCRAGTPSVTSFTAGSGFTLITTDIHDGCASEWQIAGAAGTVTPSMTMASTSTYTEIVAAFKSATAGTAPTGWYMQRMMSWSSIGPVSGNIAYQFPSSGNLEVLTNSCNTIATGTITDGTNTWAQIGTNFVGTGNTTSEYYVANATANSGGGITVNTTGTGDCTQVFYDFAGAPTAPVVTRATYNTVSSDTFQTPPLVFYPGWSSFSSVNVGKFLAQPTAGLTIADGGQTFNTSLTVSSPTGCMADAATQGGENLDGPWPVFQNNSFGHCYPAGGASGNWTFAQTASGTALGGYSGDLISFFGSTGIGIIQANYAQGTSTTDLAITLDKATTTGNLFAVNIGVSSGKTISKVCLGGNSTCSTGTQLTQLTGAVSTGTNGATSVWYVLSAPSAATTLNVVPSASSANLEAGYYEIQKGSGGTWATDGGNQSSNATGSGTTLTAAAVTTTGTNDFCASNVAVGSSVSLSPSAASNFVYGGSIFSNTNDGVASILTMSAASHSATFTDASSGDTFSSSTGCFK